MMLSRLQPVAERAFAWSDSPCPLCRGEGSDVAFEASDPASPNEMVFCVVACRHCGLQYTNPRPDADSIGQFYRGDYRPHKVRHKPMVIKDAPRYGWLTGRDSAERRGDLGRKPGRLLDFGCGGGSYLARMNARGWEVMGLDSSPDAVTDIRRELGLEAYLGSLPHPDLEPASFDVITMWHSLEHTHDPLETLRAAFDLLVPGGLCIVAVPNIGGWPARWFGSNWFGLDLPRHLTHFEPRTLNDMLAAAGFAVEQVRCLKHSDWLRSSAQLSRRRGRISLFNALRWKPVAKAAAWLTYAASRSDCLLARAVRPM